ncbi:helix-turn-helix domain-containing protein, partial [Ideonella sp.]|uniref:helix-turn-helix domain-containing protein n=1 Tax=Ideonella sp. TaxID=1929293 RepID=UPI003BB6A97F
MGDEAPAAMPFVATNAHASAGAMLRAAREAQGMDVTTLATLLKVAPRKLEQLEADAHAALQGPAFVRALAQAACRVLKLDPVPVLARLPALDQHTLEQVTGGLNAPFRERGMRRDSGSDNPLAKKGFAALVAVLILGAAVLIFWPAGFSLNAYLPGAVPTALPGQGDAAEPGSTAPTVAAVNEAPALPSSAVTSASPLPLVQPAPSAALAPVTLPATAPASAVALPAALPPSTAVSPAGPALRVLTRADSWVEIVDGSGKTLLA